MLIVGSSLMVYSGLRFVQWAANAGKPIAEDLAFATAGIRKLCAQVLAPNVASMRVLEKAGYSREALLEAEVHKDGVYFDTHLFVRHHRPPP